jgi:hypothetical protein
MHEGGISSINAFLGEMEQQQGALLKSHGIAFVPYMPFAIITGVKHLDCLVCGQRISLHRLTCLHSSTWSIYVDNSSLCLRVNPHTCFSSP